MSRKQERQRNTCLCNWPDCAKYHHAFMERKRADGDEGDDPWGGELKQFKISETVNSKAFRYAIQHHLSTHTDVQATRKFTWFLCICQFGS
jgi:hypothetical protein